MSRVLILIFILTVCPFMSEARADSEQIGTFDLWSAYVSHNRGQDMCYISARPASNDAKPASGAFAEVTHRPSEHHIGVIDILGGYTFKPGAPATLAVGGKSFTLFTHGAAAFAQDADDEKIVAAMRLGGDMVFTGTDKKGVAVKTTFGLKGMEPAYEAVSKSCKVEIPPPPRKAATKAKPKP